MAKRYTTTFTITNDSNPGTTAQNSAAVELPELPPDAVASCQVTLSDLTGGSSPTVTPDLEFSADNTNFVAAGDAGITSPAGMTTNGTTFLKNSADAQLGLAPFPYVRLKGTGGGSGAPSDWGLTATLTISF